MPFCERLACSSLLASTAAHVAFASPVTARHTSARYGLCCNKQRSLADINSGSCASPGLGETFAHDSCGYLIVLAPRWCRLSCRRSLTAVVLQVRCASMQRHVIARMQHGAYLPPRRFVQAAAAHCFATSCITHLRRCAPKLRELGLASHSIA